MDHSRALSFAIGCLLIAAGVLVYLEWWRAGELELVNDRLNDVEGRVVRLADHVAAKPAPRRRSSSSSKGGAGS